MINKKRKEIKEKMEKVKKERDDLVSKMKKHKEIRNKLQHKAKEYIGSKRKKKGEIFKNLPLRVEELKADVQMLEYRQETVPMNTSEENKLIEKLRIKKEEYKKMKQLLDQQKLLEVDISDKEQTIDDLFKKADDEHKIVEKYLS